MLHLTYANAVNCYTNNLPYERKDDSLIILLNNASEILNICDFGLQKYTVWNVFRFGKHCICHLWDSGGVSGYIYLIVGSESGLKP
jgi:hypothetical protein